MADYQFNTNLGPAAQQGTNIADMVNLARGVQAYQQAQEVNPELAKQAKIDTQSKQFKLQTDQNDAINHSLSVLSLDPDVQAGKDGSKIAHKIALQRENLVRQGVPREQIEAASAHLMTAAMQNPHLVTDYLGNLRRTAMTPGQVQTSVAGQETVEGKDIYGNPLKTVTNPNTGVKYQVRLPYAGQDQGMRYAPGESATTIEGMTAEREAAKQAAGSVAPALNNVDTILENLKLAQTGKYSDAIAGLQSAFGNLAGSTAEEKAAAARDIIQKNIADLGLQKNAALGGKFVASLQSAQESLADAGKNPTAIAKSMQQLRPLLQHARYYQQGLEKAIQKSGGDIQVKRKFDNEMIDTFDPKALIIYNAYKAGDTKALSRLSVDERKEVLEKITKYNKLVNGDL
jgi:hypothetical protein